MPAAFDIELMLAIFLENLTWYFPDSVRLSSFTVASGIAIWTADWRQPLHRTWNSGSENFKGL